MKILYQNGTHRDTSLSVTAKITYAFIIYCCVSSSLELVSIVPDNIVHYSHGKLSRSQVKDAMSELERGGYIQYEGDLIVSRSVKISPNQTFFQLNMDVVMSILSSGSRLSLCYYYILLSSCVSGEFGVVRLPMDYLCELSGLDKKTVLKYNAALEELGAVRIEHMTNHTSNIYYLT